MMMDGERMLVTIMSKAVAFDRLPNTARRSRMTRAISIKRAMITSGSMNLIVMATIIVKYFMAFLTAYHACPPWYFMRATDHVRTYCHDFITLLLLICYNCMKS